MKKIIILILSINFLFAQVQYNSNAGQSKIENAPKDNFGNAKGDSYDLSKNNAFKETKYKNVVNVVNGSGEVNYTEESSDEVKQIGQFVKESNTNSPSFVNYSTVQSKISEGKPVTDGKFTSSTVLVLQFYVCNEFDFVEPRKALESKGFSVYRYQYFPPTPEELDKALALSTQIWIISDVSPRLTDEHIKVIKKHFDQGKGLYVWGDNDPYYADANKISQSIFQTQLLGDYIGDQTIGLKEKEQDKSGVVANHLISTGIEKIYEGSTISDVRTNNKDLKPLIYNSQGKLVACVYEKEGKRAIIDGGFTRLYHKWNTAGTDRYVKNAATWLTNVENNLAKK